MRILLISRTHPHRRLGPLEARLHDRLRELSELGHDVLLLTRWTGESIDFELPSRVEVRAPFKSFQAWEWPKSLAMVFAWRPEVLHVIDPGLTTLERAVSVEMMAITMLETLRRSAKGRSTYHGVLVSHVPSSVTNRESSVPTDTWTRAGASFVESDWLRAAGSERARRAWDHADGRELRFALAGRVGSEIPLSLVIECLQAMRRLNCFQLSIFLNRASLSAAEKRELAQAERAEAFGTAVGSRLHLVDPAILDDGELGLADEPTFDAALVTGLDIAKARLWIERLPMPIVLSENLAPLAQELRGRTAEARHAQIFGSLVTELAPAAQAFAQLLDRGRLQAAWSEIEHGALSSVRDVAANHISRLYSQIARTASPS